MSIRRFSHLGLCVSDLDRASAFYQRAIGFEEVARLAFEDDATRRLLDLPDARLEAAYLRRDGFTLELLAFPSPGVEAPVPPRAMNRVGFTHLSFLVDGLDAVVEAALEAGGRLLEDTRIGDRAAFVLDPDGTRIELVAGDFDPAAYAPPG